MAPNERESARDRSVGRPLDALNFFLADVRDGLGPYLAVYLLAVQHWDAASIGVVISIGGIVGLLAQTPAGAFIDRTTPQARGDHRRGDHGHLGLAGPAAPAELLVRRRDPGHDRGGGLDLCAGDGRDHARHRRPEGFRAAHRSQRGLQPRAATPLAAALAGASAYFFGPIVVFWLMAALAAASIVATLRIPAGAIDDKLARGLTGRRGGPGTAVRLQGAARVPPAPGLRRLLRAVPLRQRRHAAAGRPEAGPDRPESRAPP